MQNLHTKTAIIQSNYIPWIGYFDIISQVDNFVFYDTVQFTKRSWRNRNYIKTPNGKLLLTIPINLKGSKSRNIEDILLNDETWGYDHFKKITYNYKKSKYYKEVSELLYETYFDKSLTKLSQVNISLIKNIINYLELETKLFKSSDFELGGDKVSDLALICNDLNSTDYLSGPFGRTYVDEDIFNKKNVELHFFDYPTYPQYTQQWDDRFIPNLSIIDILFNCGLDTRKMFSEK
mgnify:CR=1 FL=1